MAWRRIQQIEAPHHVSDVLILVIDHHGQLIGEQLVLATYNEVAAIGAYVLPVIALDQILKLNECSFGLYPHRISMLWWRGTVATGAIVDGAAAFNFRSCAVAAKTQASILQLK